MQSESFVWKRENGFQAKVNEVVSGIAQDVQKAFSLMGLSPLLNREIKIVKTVN